MTPAEKAQLFNEARLNPKGVYEGTCRCGGYVAFGTHLDVLRQRVSVHSEPLCERYKEICKGAPEKIHHI